jgi:phage baseplate assembly protein W
MTARHGYIWHPEYGAGVPQMIGSPLDPASVRATVRAQIMMERAVARNPLPQIEISKITSGLYCHITFWNADTGAQEVLQFDYSL